MNPATDLQLSAGVHPRVAELEAEVARLGRELRIESQVVADTQEKLSKLRALVKHAEWAAEGGHREESVCPWCAESGFVSEGRRYGQHLNSCPAFTPNGEVK